MIEINKNVKTMFGGSVPSKKKVGGNSFERKHNRTRIEDWNCQSVEVARQHQLPTESGRHCWNARHLTRDVYRI